MNVVMMWRWLGLVLAMAVVVVSASNSEPTLLVHPNLHESAIHSTSEGIGSLIPEAELRLLRYPPRSALDIIKRPAPKASYPPPPGNIGMQQQTPMVSVSSIISSPLMEMVLKRSEEIMGALLVNRFHLRGLDNLSIVKSTPKSKPRPAPKGYPPPPKSPLANNKARPAPKGYPPSPKTPLADVYQEQYNQVNIDGLEKM